MTASLELLRADWQAPAAVRAVCSTRLGGVSAAPWDSLNLGRSTGDVSAAVDENRLRFMRAAGLPEAPRWLSQVHGRNVVRWPECAGMQPEADAAYTTVPGVVCAVQAADCMPELFCDRQARAVAAAHAGWRGLAAGVLEATVAALVAATGDPAAQLLAWLGPCIGPGAFEVGEEVREAFVAVDPAAAQAFRAGPAAGKHRADLVLLARQRLRGAGVSLLSGGHWCTFEDRQRFYSYRRDRVTGRMAASIWLQEGRGTGNAEGRA